MYRRNASVLRPAPHPRMHAQFRRALKLDAIVAMEESVRPDPTTHEDLREMFHRRHALYEDRWRGCPERLCQRHRYCVQPRAKCTRHPAPDPTPLKDEDRAMYDRIWQSMLAERAAAVRSEKEGQT